MKAIMPTAPTEPDRHRCLTIGVLASFLVEAYANHAGAVLDQNWNSIERKIGNTFNKLDHIASKLNTKIDWDRPPFQLLRDIFAFRDSIAHGKTLTLTEPERIGTGVVALSAADVPRADWERRCEPTTVRQWIEAVEEMIRYLHTELLRDPRAVNEHPDPFAAGTASVTVRGTIRF